MGRNVVLVSFPENFIRVRFEDFAETLVVGDVAKVEVFDKVDEAREVVEDGGKMILDLVLLKESVILHEFIQLNYGSFGDILFRVIVWKFELFYG